MKQIFFVCLLISGLKSFAQNEVKWMLSGALTPSSVSLRAKMSTNSNNVRAALSTTNPPSAPFIYSNVAKADSVENNFMVRLDVSGLQPATTYYYQIEADGIEDTSPEDIGTFSTTAVGPSSFSFMAGSCNREPNTKTYNDFMNFNPLFYLNCGDLHYADPNSTDVNVHRNAYEDRVFTRPLQVELFRKLPLMHVWDDHDYCGNADDGQDVAGAKSAGRAYREYIPHYEFPERQGDDTNSIYHSFEIGRVKFIMSDLRSQRFRNDSTAMGLPQKEWFKKQLVDARDRKLLICWVGSYSWYGQFDDNWTLNPKERRELSEFMRDSLIENMFIINGDAHMFAIDNGTNGDFTAANNLPYQYPVLQAGPIENNGSFKGGTYSEGTFYQFFVKAAQYGFVEVNDNGGDSICVTMTGYKKDLSTEATNSIVSYSFCRNLGDYVASTPQVDKNQADINVFPNPSSGMFHVRSVYNKPTRCTVTGLNGQVLIDELILPNVVAKLDLRQYPSGIYFANFANEDYKISRKLVVTH